MRISKIEIDNFKSFANKTDIPFLEGFTTVSGPNGSGKSNIIDSILFCLGLSTSKTLRADRLFHLINTHNKKHEATVKVYFSDDDGNEVLSVTRKIKKSSNTYISSYHMNDKQSTLGEIHDELSKFNISPGCYNVMMQGDVTNIINISANERRKIVDELAGVAEFDRRIEQARKELETVEQRVEKSSIILSEIDYRLTQLAEEKTHALKYQKLRDEKHELENKLQVVRYFEIKNSFERLHESILDAGKSKKEEEKKLAELGLRLNETSNKLSELSELIKSKGEDEQIELKKQIESLKGIISRKQDSIKHSENLIKSNVKNIESAKTNIEVLKTKNSRSNSDIENKNDEIKSIEKNINTEKIELQRVQSEVIGINKTANAQLEQRNDLRKKLESKKDAENAILKDKMKLDDKVFRLQKDIDEAIAFINESDALKTADLERKNMLDIQLEELSKEIKDYEIVQKNNLEHLDKLKNEMSDHNYNINSAYRKIAQLEANKRAAEEAGFGKAVDTVMRSGINGVHSTLAQLGAVDKEYSTALEIAMGSRMKNIVVDNDEVASTAIEILKSSQAGRASFLPLNKMKSKPYGMKPPKDTGVIDFTINLIKFDSLYESVFYYALGDTLVVEDLNNARKLMGKYRMVTLDGSLVEKTGAMTGGSVYNTGLKFAQSQDEELETLKTRFKKLQDKAIELEKQKQSVETKLDNVRQDYSGAMTDFSKKRVEQESVVKALNEIDSRMAKSQNIINTKTPELEEDRKLLDAINIKYDNTVNEINKLVLDIEQVEKSMPENELTKLNDLTRSIETKIKQNEANLLTCHNDIKAIILEIEFNEKTIRVQEEQIIELTADNEKLITENTAFTSEITGVEARLVELKEKINEIGTELVELQRDRDTLNAEILSLDKSKGAFELKIDRLTEQVEAFKTRRKELEPELDEIRKELITQGLEVAQLKPSEISLDEANKSIARLEKRMTEMEPVNMKALTEYDEVKTRKDELENRINTLSSERIQIIEKMNGYEELKIKSFRETFDHINSNFKEIFAMLSDGEGQIILENEENPIAGGLTIEAQPRGKKMQRLEGMSGGEKSLTALAFVFAIQRYLPAPFYAFDEVDMHLDGINAEKLAQLIKTQSSNAQFIVVSLRKPMIEAADRTIGVTQKDSGITKVTGIRLYG